MDKNKLRKKIKSFENQIQKHKEKLKDYDGKNYALIGYWEKEVDRFEEEIREIKNKIK